jgi:iron complex outermembrane receptor protein
VKNSFYWLYVILFLLPVWLSAQDDSMQVRKEELKIQTIEIVGSDIKNEVEIQKRFDTKELLRVSTLTQLLEQTNGLSVRTYSPGGLATMAFRGTTSAQTNIYWNGMPIFSTQNGLFDFNLAPTYLMDGANVDPLGGIGGSIELSTDAKIVNQSFINKNEQFNNELRIKTGIGSFGWQEQGLRTMVQDSNIRIVFRAYRQETNNNFKYFNHIKQKSETLTNAHFKLSGGIFSTQIILKREKECNIIHWLKTDVWIQQAERQIPPTLAGLPSDTRQTDRSIKAILNYHIIGNSKQKKYDFSVGINTDYLRYSDSLTAINSSFHSNIFYGDMSQSNRKWFDLIDVYIKQKRGIEAQLQQANTAYYAQNQHRKLLTPYYYVDFLRRNSELKLFVRYQILSDQPAVRNYGGSFNHYWEQPKIIIRASVERAFRIPTFNDLYWNQGGNPNLTAEKSWNTELNLAKRWKWKDHRVVVRQNAYVKSITNGIIWLPTAGYWSPINMTRIRSQGLESKLNYEAYCMGIALKMEILYDYCRSFPVESNVPNDASLHKQVMYVPIHQAQGLINMSYKKWSLLYRHRFTGYRFTTADESDFLPSFQLGELSLEKSFLSRRMSNERAIIRLDILNLYNTYFETIALRPQPGRHFRLTLELIW